MSSPLLATTSRGLVQQSLSVAGGALGLFRLGLGTDKRYSLGCIISSLPQTLLCPTMRTRLATIPVLALLLCACATQNVSTQASPAKLTTYVYAYQEGSNPNNHVKHSLFLIGDGPSGQARYTAAAFQNGARYSLASSGNGTFTISGSEVVVKAGGLDAKGAIKPGEYIEFGSKRYSFAMKM
jgi:hypothetical protein